MKHFPKTCRTDCSSCGSETCTDMKCHGYVLSDGTETIYYSGDSELPEDIRTRFLQERSADYYDTSTHDSSNPSHCYYGKMEKWIPGKNATEYTV